MIFCSTLGLEVASLLTQCLSQTVKDTRLGQVAGKGAASKSVTDKLKLGIGNVKIHAVNRTTKLQSIDCLHFSQR